MRKYLVSLVLIPLLVIAGCTGQQTAAELMAVVVPVIDLIVEQQAGSVAGAKLATDLSTLELQFAAFVPGSNPANLEQILNDVVVDLKLLPLQGNEATDIELAIVTVEEIITVIDTSKSTSVVLVSNGQQVASPKTAKQFTAVRAQLKSGQVTAQAK